MSHRKASTAFGASHDGTEAEENEEEGERPPEPSEIVSAAASSAVVALAATGPALAIVVTELSVASIGS